MRASANLGFISTAFLNWPIAGLIFLRLSSTNPRVL